VYHLDVPILSDKDRGIQSGNQLEACPLRVHLQGARSSRAIDSGVFEYPGVLNVC